MPICTNIVIIVSIFNVSPHELPKRLFSDVENLLTVKRTRMKPELFSYVMFLKRNSHHFANIHPPAQQVTATPIDV
uniref:Uncharacterized protein n=1 Tax=Rhizophagus irregularis (strain DAOM 181602 / DAOM 197198 / MUCL 43194) TaxID=747089 RepID=U9UWT1_RHIID